MDWLVMRTLGGLLLAMALVATGCAGDDGDGATRTVLVDYSHDAFAGTFIEYFPASVTVRPGDTLRFEQAWNGEPHTVTMGTAVQEMLDVTLPLLEQYGHLPEEEVPPDALQRFGEATSGLPSVFPQEEGADELALNQTAAQPCFVDSGEIPDDGEACEEQDPPVYDGTQVYFNSGVIPYAGTEGNEVEVELSEDLEPGTYSYYCAVHGPFHAGRFTVAEPGSEIPSQAEVSRTALDEVRALAGPLEQALERVRAGAGEYGGQQVTGNVAGWEINDPSVEAWVNEFIPDQIEAEVGEPVTWAVVGAHTISFGDVPSYDAQLTFADDGTVAFNPQHYEPQGGWPGMPEEEEEGPEVREGEEPAAEQPEAPADEDEEEGPPEPIALDAGTWDGDGFVSSGTLEGFPVALRYTVTFAEPGTYAYACLIHPRMVAEVRVT